jgi:hypothetical protein
MALIKKYKKMKEEQISGKLLGMKMIITEISSKAIDTTMIGLLSEFGKGKDKEFDYSSFFQFASRTIQEEFSKNSTAVDLLSASIYTNGHDLPVEFDQEKIGEFSKFVFEYITMDKLNELFDGYDPARERTGLIIEGSRADLERAIGDSVTVETL